MTTKETILTPISSTAFGAANQFFPTVVFHRSLSGYVPPAGDKPPHLGDGSGSDPADATPAPFRELSRNFQRREAQVFFVAEFVLFVVIAAISAWPISSAVSAMSEYLR